MTYAYTDATDTKLEHAAFTFSPLREWHHVSVV